MTSALVAKPERKISRSTSVRVRLQLFMDSPPFLPGEDNKKPERFSVGVPPRVFGALVDLVELYEELRKLESGEQSYQWTLSRLVHKWIRATLATLSKQMGVDLLDEKQRKARFEQVLADARRDAERENNKKKR